MPPLDPLDRLQQNPIDRILRRRFAPLRARLGEPPRAELPREVIQRTIQQNEGPGLLERIGSALAYPGDIFRGLLTGQAGERITPREFLRQFNLEPQAQFDITNLFGQGGLQRLGAGLGVLATDILTDPLTAVAGIGQLGKTGKAVEEATKATTRARSLARLGRKLLPKGEISAQAIKGASPLTENLLRGLKGRENLAALIKAERSRARQLLESLPGRARPADLFQGGEPVISRLVGRKPPGAEARELISLGLPFSKGTARLPIPRPIEQAILRPTTAALGATKRALQRTFGRGIPEETRSVYRFLRETVRKGTEELGTDINSRVVQLINERTKGNAGSIDDIADQVKEAFYTDIRNARENGPVSLPQNEHEFAKELSQMVDGAFHAQIATGARNHALVEDYAERIITPEARSVLRQKKLGNAFREFMNNKARIHDASQIRRKSYLRDMLTTDVNEFFRKNVPELQGKNWFNLDPAATVELTIRDRGLSILQANLVSSLVDDFAGIAGRTGDVPIATFLADVGLKRYKGAQWSTGNVKDVAKALKKAGVDLRQTVPKEIAREVGDMLGVFKNTTPEGWQNFLRNVYDPIAGLYRSLVTTMFPGFHLRNTTGNIILNMMAGVKNPLHYKEALETLAGGSEYWAGKIGAKFNPKEFDRLERLGVIRPSQGREFAKEAGAPAALQAGNIIQRTLGRVQGASKLGMRFGDFNENLARAAHYYAKKAAGATDIEAVQSVNKYLFNYGRDALSSFERNVANRLFFFWRWNRYALPLMVGQLFEHPRRFAALGRFTTQPGVPRPVGLPEFVREAAGIPQSVDPKTGEVRFTTRFGSPFEVLGLVDPTDFEPGVIGFAKEAGREVAAQLLPPLRATLEIFAGEEFFTGREIPDLDRGSAIGTQIGQLVGKIPGLEQVGRDIGEEVPTGRPGVTKNRRAPGLRFLLRNLPTSRVTQTLARLIDAAQASFGKEPTQLRRRTLGEESLRSLLGINLADVDTEKEAINRFRRVLQRQAQASQLRGRTGQLPIFFPTQAGKTDAETQRVFQMLKAVRGRERL